MGAAMATEPVSAAELPAGSVVLRGVRRVFPDGSVALAGIDLEVRPGELVALLGPSGCGKSTLLRLVAGLDPAQQGSVLVRADARENPGAPAPTSGIAFVFQDAHLLPWRRVLANVELPLELAGVERGPRREAALEALERVGLAEATALYPAQLSGGMRMRVSLARAVIAAPRILLLDEPFAALDELTRARLDEQLLELWHRSGMTVLFVTHSVSEAAFLAQRVVVLSPRPAVVVAEVAVGLERPRTPELRTAPEFNAVVRRLHTLLAAGERE